ncbi:MAG: DUF3015 domain-containing protein [Methylococcaceae bacterium]|nr:DUF3015 domain-containing protein [Methylococcaceae bacterium]
MKTYLYPAGVGLIAASLLSGCSSITDTVAASTQTFTNSSESSTNASKDSPSAKNNTEQAIEFAKVNWMQLSSNMSKGQGEHLAAIASLLSVKEAKKPAFYTMTQDKFSSLFKSTETTAEQLVSSLQLEIINL